MQNSIWVQASSQSSFFFFKFKCAEFEIWKINFPPKHETLDNPFNITNFATSMAELPIEILHKILSTKTAARIAVLSKPLLKACYNSSNLCFDQSDFGENNGIILHFHDQFVTFVDNTLEREDTYFGF